MVLTGEDGDDDTSSRHAYNHKGIVKLPVVILTGYLGAGKTTLLNYILQEQKERKLAVIENEVGEVSIDDALVEKKLQSSGQEMILLDNGCVCCTIRGDLVNTLNGIAQRHVDGMTLDGVIIELTGVADPAPVVQTFMAVEEVCNAFYVDNVVALVDAKHAIDKFAESQQNPLEKGTFSAQIAFSSTVLLNKIDLADEAQLTQIERCIIETNSTVTILRCKEARVPIAKLFNVGIFDLGRVLEEQYMEMEEFKTLYKPKMDRSVSNVGIRCCGAVNVFAVEQLLDKYLDAEETAKDFLRVKAVLDVQGSDRKYVIQCVHMIRNCGFVEPWSDGELHENRIIFIGRGMQDRREALQEGFKSCFAKPLRFEEGTEVQVKVDCASHHHHHHSPGDHMESHFPQDSPNPVIQMQPGKIGCTLLTNGVVESIAEGGMASLAGVQEGWQVISVDDLPFSYDVLDPKVFGDEVYSLTFTTEVDRVHWEAGCILKQWDECNAYRIKLETGMEILVPLDDPDFIDL